ncbi:nucleotidyltransferase domain-containing protein [Halomonas sp. GT]|uniref:nucleotidyltransferase domain-containing protein n=1 Tax=Halomonas sp. GT TaxID=1971364 RepID=UPI0009F4B6D0|nr:nucleotidyltransferase [Halomonas sp. GT]
MSQYWRDRFSSWSRPPSDSEEDKADRAARMINDAISRCVSLENKRTSVYGTGSYKNNTNTRNESDIDIAVVLHDCFFSEYPVGQSPQAEDLGHEGGVTYGLKAFREDVGRALEAKFGRDGVTAGSKAFDVHSNTARLDADVAVFLEHHRYTGKINADGTWHYLEGVEMRDRDGSRIINWHQDHYANGVNKNYRTSRRYKRIARVLKCLRNDMKNSAEQSVQQAADVPSFFLECLAFNASDACYQQGDLYNILKAVITELWNGTKPEGDDFVYVEVSGLKWLFGREQPWTKATAHCFLLNVWQHVGFTK